MALIFNMKNFILIQLSIHFCPENVVCFKHLLHMIEKINVHFRLLLIMEANTMNPDQTAPKSSLIWVHIVCNIGFQSVLADK